MRGVPGALWPLLILAAVGTATFLLCWRRAEWGPEDEQ